MRHTTLAVLATVAVVAALLAVPGPAGALDIQGDRVLVAHLSFGKTKTLLRIGTVSVEAECLQLADRDAIRLLAATTVDGASMHGVVILSGLLDVVTPPDGRLLCEDDNNTPGQTATRNGNCSEFGAGFVRSGDTRFYIGLNGNAAALGLNDSGYDCTVRVPAFYSKTD